MLFVYDNLAELISLKGKKNQSQKGIFEHENILHS